MKVKVTSRIVYHKIGDGMVDEDAEVEHRYDILDESGNPTHGGHV